MSQTKDTTKQQAAAAAAGSDDEEELQTQKAKSDNDENSAMEKLTDLVEEKQMDGNKMKLAFQALCKQEEAHKEAERLLEKKLTAVKVRTDDVALVAQEMEISTQQADRKLREADGDVVKCLHALVAA
uniref:Nascent polypeptide-associated complex subunit alpha-like UBA domain-containing protein n=1 Tax=Peronospora matthiolae TaxID=2874970 RepID=A0AAV1US52_9STRA